jgi:hypothetical protein
MPVLRLCLLSFLLFLSVNPGYAQVFGTAADYTFTTIDVPGASSTEVSGINNAGTMVGRLQ